MRKPVFVHLNWTDFFYFLVGYLQNKMKNNIRWNMFQFEQKIYDLNAV
jgi:hypothetical protein